jgi:hypothetical protein
MTWKVAILPIIVGLAVSIRQDLETWKQSGEPFSWPVAWNRWSWAILIAITASVIAILQGILQGNGQAVQS